MSDAIYGFCLLIGVLAMATGIAASIIVHNPFPAVIAVNGATAVMLGCRLLWKRKRNTPP